MVIVAICVCGLTLFVAVGGHCRVYCHVSPVSYLKKKKGEGGRVTHLYQVLV